jgi:hypothetical protein
VPIADCRLPVPFQLNLRQVANAIHGLLRVTPIGNRQLAIGNTSLYPVPLDNKLSLISAVLIIQ